jgi:hypothetical protein
MLTEQLLKKQLKNKYGDFSLIRLTGGYTNATFLLEGTYPLLLLKWLIHLTRIFIMK